MANQPMRSWDAEEVRILKAAYPKGGAKNTRKALVEAGFEDRTVRSVIEAAVRYGVRRPPTEARLTPTGVKILRALSEFGPTYTWEFPLVVNAGEYGVKTGLARARRLGLIVGKRNGRGANLPLLWEITAKGERYLKALKGR